jgi:5-methylcytosine-specific restriction endonuclease McrA
MANKKKKAVPAKIAALVKARDNHICRACGFGGSANYAFALECDHIVPESAGGATALENLQCLCGACNRAKGNRFARQFKVRAATTTEEIWSYNQRVMTSAFAAKTESDLAERLRKIK